MKIGVNTMEKCFMLFRDDKIYIKSSKSSKVAEYTLNNPVRYPSIPLYFNIFNDEKIIEDLKIFIKNNVDINGLIKGIFAKKVFLLLPDDVVNVTDIERRAFDEFAKMLFGVKRVILASECAFVTPFEEKEYICISKTCRMLILSYTKDKNTFKQKFIENKEYTNKELYALISELCEGVGGIPKVYLNGINLSQYSDLGIIIDSLELINNFETTIDYLKIK
jgi:hypothetical protein